MKKTLRSILAGALALVAVSCYDDSALNEAVNKLGDRVSTIEATLSAEVGGVADLLSRVETLEGKVAAIKVETKDGVTTLTLSDESSVVLSKNGVLTIVDGGWATVAPDGTVTPVGVQVGHDLDLKVEDGKLNVYGTKYDVDAKEYKAHVKGSVETSEDGKTVTLTIGDYSVTLPLAVEGAVALSRENMYVGYGFSKTVTVSGAEDFYVAAKPDGWKVDIEGNVLTVTAPSQALVEFGAGHTTGKLVVHADDNGCAYASMDLEAGPAFSLKADKATGDITFFNAIACEEYDYWGDFIGYKFADAELVILTLSDFEYVTSVDDILEYVDGGALPSAYLSNIKNNEELGARYEEGKYEEDTFTISLTALAKAFDPKVPIEEGMAYVVCAIPMDADGYLKDNYSYAIYKPAKTEFEARNITHNDAVLWADLSGAEKYYVGICPKPVYDGVAIPLEQLMEQAYPLNYILYGGASEVQDYYIEGLYDGDDAYTMSYLNFDEKLTPGTTYYYFVLPCPEGVDYTYNMQLMAQNILYKEFTTATLTEGDVQLPQVADEQVTYTSVKATMTPAEGTTVYYAFVTSELEGELETNEDKLNYLLENCRMPLIEPEEVNKSSLKAGTTTVLLYAAVTEDATYAVGSDSFTTLSYPSVLDETLAVGMSDAAIDLTTISVDLTVTDGTKAYWKYFPENQVAEGGLYGTTEKLRDNLISMGKNASEESTALREYLSPNQSQVLVVVVVKDNTYRVIKQTYTTNSLTYSESITVDIVPESIVFNEAEETMTVKVKVEGATKAAFQLNYGSSAFTSFELYTYLLAEDENIKYVDVVDGYAEATLTDCYGTGVYVCVTGYNVDADGKVTALAKTGGNYYMRDYLPTL